MSDSRGSGSGPMWNGVPEEDALRALLEKAGPRAPLAQAELARIEERARHDWRARYGPAASSGRRLRGWMAAAAAALLVGAGLLWKARTNPPPSPAAAASLARLSGTARVHPPGQPSLVLSGAGSLGQPVIAGTQIATESRSALALRMAEGASVRLDADTRIRLVDSDLLELASGAVYVDTGAVPGDVGVSVRTPAGLFRPQGTQFEIRVERGGSATRLRVRRGTVSLDGRGERAAAGEELIVQRDGTMARGSVAPEAEAWRWAMRAAPMLDIEDTLLKNYLDWVAREAGWRVEFADREAASRAESTVLHGSIDHLTPEESPGVVLSSCGMGHRLSNGALVVFVVGTGR